MGKTYEIAGNNTTPVDKIQKKRNSKKKGRQRQKFWTKQRNSKSVGKHEIKAELSRYGGQQRRNQIYLLIGAGNFFDIQAGRQIKLEE